MFKSFSKFKIIASLFAVLFISCFININLNKASADSIRIVTKSEYCIDLYHGNVSNDAPVMLWTCDKTSAQSWTENLSTITHDEKYCLSVSDKFIKNKNSVVVQSCNGGANQVWLNSKNKLYNPDTQMCLTTSMGNGSQLIVDNCNKKNLLTWNSEDMSGAVISRNLNCNKGDRSYKLSCNAIKQWEDWVDSNNHMDLLSKYTINSTYEQWCADFISYIYKEAGFPFKSAVAGWNENVAVNLQNYNFTIHDATSGYVPKSGDVAFFDYDNGGHVELVVSGGSKPTMIYGNSGRIDPQTNNGDMRANTIMQIKDKGSLIYYLSPN